MRGETRELMELFIRTADELESWEFVSQLRSSGGPWRVSMHQEEDGSWTIEDVSPNDAGTRAFLTTLRKFCARDDRVSLGLLGRSGIGKFDRAVLDDRGLSNTWVGEYQKLRAGLLHYLGEPYGASAVDADFPTRRDILDTFINGLVFHDDERKLDLYDKWANYSEKFGLLLVAFNSIVYTIYTVIIQMAEISKREIGV